MDIQRNPGEWTVDSCNITVISDHISIDYQNHLLNSGHPAIPRIDSGAFVTPVPLKRANYQLKLSRKKANLNK